MNLILGKSKTGKSKCIFDMIDKDIKNGKQVIYFVPSQMRVLSEENYINFQDKPGIIDFKITTISSYVKDFLKQYNINNEDKHISKQGRKLLLTKIILENDKLFNIFKKVKNKEGFIETLNIYMDIFKKSDIDINNIDELNINDKILEYKLKEITSVYKEYVNYTKDIYIDHIDEMDMFLKLFNDIYINKDVSNYSIYFDSYNNFTNHELKFIKLLIKFKFNITLSIVTNIADKVDDINNLSINEIRNLLLNDVTNIFTIPNLTLITLLKVCRELNIDINIDVKYNNYLKSNDDIKYLSDNIFISDIIKKKIKPENIHINLTTNIYTEVEKIALYISEYIRNGYRYKDFVIYTSSTDEYSYVVRKIFYEYNIPVYIDYKQPIQSNVLIKYILKLIEICKYGYKQDNIFQILKFGLNHISDDDISYIENYVLEYNSDRYKFEKEFTLNSDNKYDLKRLNDIRNKILDIFDDIVKFTNAKQTTLDIINKIYEHLIENKVIEKYTLVIHDMRQNIDPNIKYTGDMGYLVWDKLCEVFNSIDTIYSDTKINIIDFNKLINYSLKDIKLKGVEPTNDQVSVLDINSSKSGSKKVIFFVGVNENKLPKKIDDDLLFNDIEISNLESYNIKFKETSLFKINMGLYNIYEQINNSEEKIYFSFVSSDTSGKSLRPSSLITILKNILDIQVKGDVTNIEEKHIYSNKSALEKLIKLVNNNDTITDEMIILYRYISNYSNLDNVLSYIRENEKLNDSTINELIKTKFITSVTKLELFKKCPFAYFMKYGLKINERKIYTVTSLDTGSFMHNVLESFSLYLFSNNINWHEILLEKEKYIKILEEIINKELDKTFIKHKDNVKYVILKQKLKNTMNKVIFVIAQSFNQSKFVPFGYEIEFKENGLFAPIEIKLR